MAASFVPPALKDAAGGQNLPVPAVVCHPSVARPVGSHATGA